MDLLKNRAKRLQKYRAFTQLMDKVEIVRSKLINNDQEVDLDELADDFKAIFGPIKNEYTIQALLLELHVLKRSKLYYYC
jgi:hypothetical protein